MPLPDDPELRLAVLRFKRSQALARGDVAMVAVIDAEIAQGDLFEQVERR